MLETPKVPAGIDSDVYKSTEDLARDQGLNYEEHIVITEDGYHLLVQHIWKSRGGDPVFFQHGLFSSSDTWILNKEKSLAFRTAQAGYDVWLGNNRGTKYSRVHETLDPTKDSDKKFYFDYSFYELGKYDAPA